MAALLDRGLVFLLSILLINVEQVDYLIVCLLLVAIISICINVYFDNELAVKISSVVFIVLGICVPKFACFAPLMIYECGRKKVKIMIPFHGFVGIAWSLIFYTDKIQLIQGGKITIFMIIAYVLGVRSAISDRKDRMIHKLQDDRSYLRQNSKQKQDELLRRQDFEIHAATLAERNRIAREIHDHVGHMISRAILQLGAVMTINKEDKLKEPLSSLKDSLDTAMNNIRESVHDIKDEALDLEYMIKDVLKTYEGLDIQLDYDMNKYASKELKYCFVAVIKEALTNTVKHSDATKVQIVVREHPALYQLLIEDNGSLVSSDKNDKTGIGLDNMRERVSAFNGNMLISREQGFKIFISIAKEN